jgi:hypothetical protein
MKRIYFFIVCLLLQVTAKQERALEGEKVNSLRMLPRLNLFGNVTISGISSGADAAVQFHVANSDIINGSAIFAGQAYGCAVHRFATEPQFGCLNQSYDRRGPGCDGMPWGPAPCYDCDGGPNSQTVTYDHCKIPNFPQLTQIDVLLKYARDLEANGDIPPLSYLEDDSVYLYRGTKDDVYVDGSVNNTLAFFQALNISSFHFEAAVPSAHCWPSTAISPDEGKCGGSFTLQNCGYDGAGAALQFLYGGSLIIPSNISYLIPNNLIMFYQFHYSLDTPWAGQGKQGYVYIPSYCNNGPCRLHVALHGCGMSASNPSMGMNFVYFTGLNAWAEANNLVILYPQMGGFIDYNITAPAAQLEAACFDGYGQSGVDYASTSGPQMLSIRNMISALYGGNDAFYNAGLTNLFSPKVRGPDINEDRPDRITI